jgi:hypothetical protein
MTNLGSIEARAIKHICLVGDRDAMVQGMMHTFILRSGRLAASRRMRCVLTWFETREHTPLAMTTDRTGGMT